MITSHIPHPTSAIQHRPAKRRRMRPFTITPPPCQDIIIPDGVEIGPAPENGLPKGVRMTADMAPAVHGSARRHNPSQPRPEKVSCCKVPGCKRRDVRSHGLCAMHGSRYRKAGKPNLKQFIAETYPGDLRRDKHHVCQVPGCNNVHRGLGLCAKHHTRWRKAGRPDLDQFIATTPAGRLTRRDLGTKRTDRRCDVPGCDRPHAAHGLCKTHYAHWRYHDEPNRDQFIQQQAKGKGQKAEDKGAAA
jgi:hypothetical protein